MASDQGETLADLIFDKYSLLEHIGQGRMADVYKAMPADADEYSRPVVIRRIKQHLAGNPVFMDMLLTATRTAATLSHPNIVHVHDFGYFRDAFYMVQEYVPGIDLGALLKFYMSRASVLEPSAGAYIAINICQALEFAHGRWDPEGRSAPVIHRNLTPKNVLLSIDGAVKTSDFGLSIPLGAARTSSTAEDVDKFAYLSPEQAVGRHDLEVTSDLYSFGVIIYELLSGHRAFGHEGGTSSLEDVREGTILPIELVSSTVPAALSDLVGRLLIKERGERLDNAREVRTRLEAYLRGVMRPVTAPVFGELVCDIMDELAALEEEVYDPFDDLDEDDDYTQREGHSRTIPDSFSTPLRQVVLPDPTVPDEEVAHSTTTEAPTRSRRREVRIPCTQWETFVTAYKDSISQRGIDIDVQDPPRPGSLLNVIFELPNGEHLKIPGEVYRVEDDAGQGRVSVVMELSSPTETKVHSALQVAEHQLGFKTITESPADILADPSNPSVVTEQDRPWEREPLRKKVQLNRTPILGVDFGTSYSSAAVIEDGNLVTIADEDGRVAIPSMVWFRSKNDFVIGHEAFDHMARDPASTVTSAKRLIGRRFDDPDLSPLISSYACPVYAASDRSIKFEVNRQIARPHEIAAIVLRYIKELAQEQLGQPIKKAVLAYPVSFDELQVAFLQKAARMAGLHVAALLPEPVAVAIGHNPAGEGYSVLGVFDFGGGSTSFSVLSVTGGTHQVAGFEADAWLGGEELTRTLASVVATSFHHSTGIDIRRNAFDYQRVLQRCELAKWALSLGDEANIHVERVSAPGRSPVKLDVTVDPDRFRAISKDVVERSIGICLRGLKSARVGRGELTEVLLTGAMRRLPDAQPAIRDLFGFDPHLATVPEISVAIGTAVQGAKLEGLTVMPRRAPTFTQRLARPETDMSWVVSDDSITDASFDGDSSVETRKGEMPPVTDEDEPSTLDVAFSGDVGVEESHAVWSEVPPEDDEMRPSIGISSQLGRYELLAEIGAGGMASIYLSKISGPAGFQKPVALKVIHSHLSHNKYFLNLFLDEARLASQLQHPNIVQIFELGEDDGIYYIAMECLSGETVVSLGSRLVDPQRGAMDPRIACYIALQAAEGLHYAHEMTDLDGTPMELVHRDVSPQNIFVTYSGGIKLLDFGVAKAAGRSQETPTGELKGKFAYMSPEQIRENQVDRRCDVFALGINLWEMLTNKRLFMSRAAHSILTKVCSGIVPSVREFQPDVPEALERVCFKALEKDPDHRYSTAMDFQEDLLSAALAIGGPITPQALSAALDHAYRAEKQEWQAFMSAAMSGRPSRTPFRKSTTQPKAEEGMATIPDDDDDDSPAPVTLDEDRGWLERSQPSQIPQPAPTPPPSAAPPAYVAPPQPTPAPYGVGSSYGLATPPPRVEPPTPSNGPPPPYGAQPPQVAPPQSGEGIAYPSTAPWPGYGPSPTPPPSFGQPYQNQTPSALAGPQLTPQAPQTHEGRGRRILITGLVLLVLSFVLGLLLIWCVVLPSGGSGHEEGAEESGSLLLLPGSPTSRSPSEASGPWLRELLDSPPRLLRVSSGSPAQRALRGPRRPRCARRETPPLG